MVYSLLWAMQDFPINRRGLGFRGVGFVAAAQLREVEAHGIMPGTDFRRRKPSRPKICTALPKYTHRPLRVPFCGSYLESYKVLPKRNYLGAYG